MLLGALHVAETSKGVKCRTLGSGGEWVKGESICPV